MDKYDEKGERMCLTWTHAHKKVVAPNEIPCGMCSTFAANLREAAADAYDTVAESIEEAKKMPGIDMSPLSKALREKSLSLRSKAEEGK